MGDADKELIDSFFKETCKSLYDLSYKVEDYLTTNPCDCCGRKIQESEILFKTRFALQIITGCDEEDAIDLDIPFNIKKAESQKTTVPIRSPRIFRENKDLF